MAVFFFYFAFISPTGEKTNLLNNQSVSDFIATWMEQSADRSMTSTDRINKQTLVNLISPAVTTGNIRCSHRLCLRTGGLIILAS